MSWNTLKLWCFNCDTLFNRFEWFNKVIFVYEYVFIKKKNYCDVEYVYLNLSKFMCVKMYLYLPICAI